jgi:hypothetical protein
MRAAVPSISLRALVATAACALVGLAAVVPLAGAAESKQRRTRLPYTFGGSTNILFDPALMASLGIVVEPRGTLRPAADGSVRYKIYDGKTTLKVPLKSTIFSAGNLGLEQESSGNDLNFTDVTVRLKPTKSVLSAQVGANIGYGGPRQTLLRIAQPPGSVIVTKTGIQLKNVPITLTAVGVTVFNTQFGAGLPTPPFALNQVVGTLNLKTKYYFPKPRGRRRS